MKLKTFFVIMATILVASATPISAQEEAELRYQLVETERGIWEICEDSVFVCRTLPKGYSVLPFSFTSLGDALVCRSAGGFVDLRQCFPVTTAINFAPVKEVIQK